MKRIGIFEECKDGNHSACPREIMSSGENPDDGAICSCLCHQRPASFVSVSIIPRNEDSPS